MPQRPSAEKALRQNKKRRQHNKSIKSRLGTERKKFERAVEHGDAEEAREQLDFYTKLLHQAVSKNIMHENTAARRQSSCQKMLNGLTESSQ
ncbi:MAG: 30S ribosomal protein S20 [Planctomycetes bacterium]|nr:30S ribosomal protein S20 [Planctomycetota bacterium]